MKKILVYKIYAPCIQRLSTSFYHVYNNFYDVVAYIRSSVPANERLTPKFGIKNTNATKTLRHTKIIKKNRIILYSILVFFFFCYLKIDVALKIIIGSKFNSGHQNSIMVYHKFNGDFKNHINYDGTKEKYKNDIYIYIYITLLKKKKKKKKKFSIKLFFFTQLLLQIFIYKNHHRP
jgi:hypothetical protein